MTLIVFRACVRWLSSSFKRGSKQRRLEHELRNKTGYSNILSKCLLFYPVNLLGMDLEGPAIGSQILPWGPPPPRKESQCSGTKTWVRHPLVRQGEGRAGGGGVLVEESSAASEATSRTLWGGDSGR